jgi:hypothetical protein
VGGGVAMTEQERKQIKQIAKDLEVALIGNTVSPKCATALVKLHQQLIELAFKP